MNRSVAETICQMSDAHPQPMRWSGTGWADGESREVQLPVAASRPRDEPGGAQSARLAGQFQV